MKRELVLGLALVSMSSACAFNKRTPATKTQLQELWKEPTDIGSRDLYYGTGGQSLVPNPGGKYKFLEEKTNGTQPGYEVEDVETGTKWSAKFGVETRPEVTASRIVWAVGFYQPISYYVPRWTLVDKQGKETVQQAARFRLEPPKKQKGGYWSWNKNPFVGSRELNGLFTLMIMLNNWDIKKDQNSVYMLKASDGVPSETYLVRDLGASFGKTRWLSFGTKDDIEGFEKEPFIVGASHNRVRFAFEGSWLTPQMLGSIAPGDVRWVCGLLARITDKQWHDAFKAGAYSDEEAARVIGKLKAKIAEGLAVQG